VIAFMLLIIYTDEQGHSLMWKILYKKESEDRMHSFRFKKLAPITLSVVVISVSMLCSVSSSAASSTDPIKAASSPTELAYVTNNEDNTVSVIDTASKKVVDTISVKGYPKAIAVSPDGKKAYVGTNDGVKIIDTQDEAVIDSIGEVGSLYAIAIAPDNRQQLYVTSHGKVLIINTETNKIVKTISVGNFNHAIAISPDGTQAYVTHDGSVSIIDTEKQKVTTTITVGEFTHAPDAVAFTPDGKQAYVAEQGKISVIDTAEKKIVATIDIGKPFYPSGVVFTPDGKRAYVAKSDTKSKGIPSYEVVVINTAIHQIVKTIKIDKIPLGIAITSDGKEVYVAIPLRDIVSVIDTKTNIVHNVIPVGKLPHQISMAPSQQ
jgi:YVTN family beta-propeller protein